MLQNQRVGTGALQMLLALEKTQDPQATTLEEIRPRQMWIELGPGAHVSTACALRWHNQPGYPAPAWGLDVPDWPADPQTQAPARPVVRVWWSPDEQMPADASLERGHDFDALVGLAGQQVRVADDVVTVEDVAVEQHVVQTAPGLRQPQSCLVVRLKHPPNRSVWTRVTGPNTAGAEHRFYTRIGRYTGLFWPVTADEADEQLKRVGLVSLEEFKAKAHQRGFVLDMDQLPPPEPGDRRPRPPIELK